MSQHKYNASRKSIDGYSFSSKKEADRYLFLKMLQTAGKIRDLELQPKFTLQEGFEYDGKKIRAITYRADFKYFDKEKNIYIVEEVKGFKTQDFILRWKMCLNKYKYKKAIVFKLI